MLRNVNLNKAFLRSNLEAEKKKKKAREYHHDEHSWNL